MKKNPTLKGIIFDMDGVIILTCAMHEIAWKEAAEILQYSWKGLNFKKDVFGTVSADSARLLFGNDLSGEALNELIKVKDHCYEKILQENIHEVVVPGALSFIKTLKKSGYKIALATSSTPNEAEFVLNALDIDKYFDVKINISYVSKAKPDPEIYLVALEKLDLDASECIAFEDSLSGVKSVIGANIKCILVKTSLDETKMHDNNLKFIAGIHDFNRLDCSLLLNYYNKIETLA